MITVSMAVGSCTYDVLILVCCFCPLPPLPLLTPSICLSPPHLQKLFSSLFPSPSGEECNIFFLYTSGTHTQFPDTQGSKRGHKAKPRASVSFSLSDLKTSCKTLRVKTVKKDEKLESRSLICFLWYLKIYYLLI